MSSSFAPCSATAQGVAPDPSKHVNYVLGMVLGVDDLAQEFAYQSGRDRSLARELHGYGTVTGLQVTTDQSAGKARVLVTAGLAIDTRGEFIRVPKAQCAVIDDWIAANNADAAANLGSPIATSLTLYVSLAYQSCATDLLPVPGEPCRTLAQSMAPSRWTDGFQLALGFDRPGEPFAEAVTEFAAWLGMVEVTDEGGPYATLDQFLAAVREAGQITSPLGALPFGSPLSAMRIHPADAPAYFRAAFRVWATELRPAWSNLAKGDPPAETRVLLAELTVPVVFASGRWQVDGTRAVAVHEEARPVLVPTQLLQETLWRPSGRTGGSVVGWGQFDATGVPLSAPVPVTATQPISADKSVFLLTFTGWSPTARYVVKGAPLVGFKTASGATFAVIRSDDTDLKTALGGNAPAGIVVRSGVSSAPNTFTPVGFSVEISRID